MSSPVWMARRARFWPMISWQDNRTPDEVAAGFAHLGEALTEARAA